MIQYKYPVAPTTFNTQPHITVPITVPAGLKGTVPEEVAATVVDGRMACTLYVYLSPTVFVPHYR